VLVEILLDDEHKVSLMDTSAEEKAESEKTEVEGEAEIDYWVSDFAYSNMSEDQIEKLSCRAISNVLNPYVEIHLPPPDRT